MTFVRRVSALVASAIALTVVVAVNAQDTEIGVTAAVNPEAAGTPPSQARRVLAVGTNVFSQERVVTGERGQTQMLFLDESALTIGPNSDMVLDEFIYDPDTETGSLVMNATKGVFRLVGGKISKKNPVILKTPTATIGIRGGITIANVAENGATSATFLFGESMSVTSGGVTKVATRPGYQITVEGDDAAPSDPAPVDPGELVASLDTLESGGNQSGGTEDAPDDSDVAGSGVGAAGSENDPGDVAPHEVIAPEEIQELAEVGTGETVEDDTTGKGVRRADEEEATAELGEAQQSAGIAGTDGIGALIGANAFQGRIFRSFNRAAGLVVGQGALLFADSVLGGFYSGTAITNFVGNQTFQVSFPSTPGTFSVASFTPFDTVTGTGFLTADSEFVFYNLTEAGNPANRQLLFAGVPVTTIPTTGFFFYDDRPDFLLDSNVPFVPRDSGGSLTPVDDDGGAVIIWDASAPGAHRAAGGVKIVFNQDALTSPTTQDSVISLWIGEVLIDSLTGEPFLDALLRGSARLDTQQQVHFFDGPVGTINTEGDAGDPSGHFFGGDTPYYFVAFGFSNSGSALSSATFPGIADGFGAGETDYQPAVVYLRDLDETIETRTTRTLRGYSGGVSQDIVISTGALLGTSDFQNTNSDPADITIDTNAATNKLAATFKVSDQLSPFDPFVVTFGDFSASSTGHSVFLEDDGFGAIESPVGGTTVDGVSVVDFSYMVTDEVDNDSLLPAGVFECDCKFLAWGFWGVDLLDNLGGVRDSIHLAQWVAGDVASDVQISALTGTATYNGHAIATVISNSDVYTAIGGFNMTVDFDSPASSTFAISDFDGGSFSGAGLTFGNVSGLNIFDGSLTGAGVHLGVNGSMRGSFMKDLAGDSTAAEAGAHRRVSNGTYTANGIIAAAASVAP